MSKPRVAILHYSTPPTIGGVESTIGDHARLFAAHGYPLKLITGRGETFDPQVPVQVIPTIHSRDERVEQIQRELARGKVPDAFYALAHELRGALESALADVDVLIAHNVTSLHKNLALTAALKQLTESFAVRLIAWAHDFAWTDPVYQDEVHDGFPWDLLREKWSNTRYVVVSAARRQELAKLLNARETEIDIVPPGLDAAAFLHLSETGKEWASRFEFFESIPLLLLPARVTRRKNIELAIKVTAELTAQGMKPKLLVMGPLGPHNPANRAYLEELYTLRVRRGVEQEVLFLDEFGAVDDVTRRDLYLLSDALFFPSAREGFGIPILEAGLARLPIFCSDIPPFRESAQEYAHFFSLTDSPAEIARLIRSVLKQDRPFRLKQRVIKEYNWERIFVEKIEPLINQTKREPL